MRIAAFRLCWQALQMVQPLRCKWLCWMRMLSVHSFRQLQVLVKEMIDAWGPSGLEQHARTMQQAYAHRAQVVLGAAGAPMIPVGPAARSSTGTAHGLRPLPHFTLHVLLACIDVDCSRVTQLSTLPAISRCSPQNLRRRR